MSVRDLLKLSHHSYSGRLRPHEHTSYLPLSLLVLFAGVVLAGFTASTLAASPPPEANSVSLTGTLPEAPPAVAATIDSPANQQHFSTSPVAISGTCPTGTIVEVFKNDIFAGSSPCDDQGSYSFKIDLLYGKNDLIARVYDALNQAGPDSNTVTVYYDVLPVQTEPLELLNLDNRQFLLNTDAVYRGVFPNHPLNIHISILGGTPPFAVNVLWGDLSNSVISRADNEAFNAEHTYTKPGVFEVSIQASDNKQRAAFLQIAVIVNGQPATVSLASTTTPKATLTTRLLVLWPLYAMAATVVVSFWMGEQREKRILRATATVHA